MLCLHGGLIFLVCYTMFKRNYFCGVCYTIFTLVNVYVDLVVFTRIAGTSLS